MFDANNKNLTYSTVIYDINFMWERLHLLKISHQLRCTQNCSMASNSAMNNNLNWGTHQRVISRGSIIWNIRVNVHCASNLIIRVGI